MTANQNSRSLGSPRRSIAKTGSKTTPNKKVSASDVSVPSHTPSGRCLYQRLSVGLNVFNHASHLSRPSAAAADLSHFSLPFHPCNPRHPRSVPVPSAPSCSSQKSPNYFKFTLHNLLIYRFLTLSNLNPKKFLPRPPCLANSRPRHNKNTIRHFNVTRKNSCKFLHYNRKGNISLVHSLFKNTIPLTTPVSLIPIIGDRGPCAKDNTIELRSITPTATTHS
jgi:hypothetical protein